MQESACLRFSGRDVVQVLCGPGVGRVFVPGLSTRAEDVFSGSQ